MYHIVTHLSFNTCNVLFVYEDKNVLIDVVVLCLYRKDVLEIQIVSGYSA